MTRENGFAGAAIALALSVAITFLLLLPGLRFFRRSEHHFADAL